MRRALTPFAAARAAARRCGRAVRRPGAVFAALVSVEAAGLAAAVGPEVAAAAAADPARFWGSVAWLGFASALSGVVGLGRGLPIGVGGLLMIHSGPIAARVVAAFASAGH